MHPTRVIFGCTFSPQSVKEKTSLLLRCYGFLGWSLGPPVVFSDVIMVPPQFNSPGLHNKGILGFQTNGPQTNN